MKFSLVQILVVAQFPVWQDGAGNKLSLGWKRGGATRSVEDQD